MPGDVVLGMPVAFTILSAFAVALRFYARTRMKMRLGWDDWIMLLAVVSISTFINISKNSAEYYILGLQYIQPRLDHNIHGILKSSPSIAPRYSGGWEVWLHLLAIQHFGFGLRAALYHRSIYSPFRHPYMVQNHGSFSVLSSSSTQHCVHSDQLHSNDPHQRALGFLNSCQGKMGPTNLDLLCCYATV